MQFTAACNRIQFCIRKFSLGVKLGKKLLCFFFRKLNILRPGKFQEFFCACCLFCFIHQFIVYHKLPLFYPIVTYTVGKSHSRPG